MKEILKKLREEMNLLNKLNAEHAPDGKYFFAFSQEQFEEGKRRIDITDNNLLRDVGMGMFGTPEAIKAFWDFNEEKTKRIREQISPLAFFYYEYGNHEGEYSLEGEAWDLTKEVYPDFDFNDEYNAKVIRAIRDEWNERD